MIVAKQVAGTCSNCREESDVQILIREISTVELTSRIRKSFQLCENCRKTLIKLLQVMGDNAPQESSEPQDDIRDLPLGTRVYITNGEWYGRICGSSEEKFLFVEATGETKPLKDDHGLEYMIARDMHDDY